jgi:hypothetical protein
MLREREQQILPQDTGAAVIISDEKDRGEYLIITKP